MRFQWKLLILLLALALAPIALMRTFGAGIARQIRDKMVSQTHDHLVAETRSRLQLLVQGYAATLWMGREWTEMTLWLQAEQVERALANPGDFSRRIYFTKGFMGMKGRAGGSRLPDLMPSADHWHRGDNGLRFVNVSLGHQVFTLSPTADADAANTDAARLVGLDTFYQKLFRRTRDYALWHFTATADGLTAFYPGHEGLPRHMNPEEQIWYRQALKNDVPWTDPYVDPITRQVVVSAVMPVKRPHGQIAGVTGITLSVSKLLEMRLLSRNLNVTAWPFMGYLESDETDGPMRARILAKESYADQPHRHWNVLLEPEWLSSEDATQFQAMLADVKAGIDGSRRMRFQGQDCLWVYGPTHPRGFLVLIAPYAEILQVARTGELAVQSQIDRLTRLTLYGILSMAILVVLLSVAFSRTVTRPLKTLAQGAKRLARGDFNYRVDIRSGDEFGELGRLFNAVGPQLQERSRLQRSLELAMEVQQNLLPHSPPRLAGLDIHGRSHYCDETGGDYFDYLLRGSERQQLAVVVGDVAGHGVSSALLMTTARALIRQRASQTGDLAQLVGDVNRLLVEDVGTTGQFMTLFCLEIDPRQGQITWVRAGHDPAMLYDVAQDQFEELDGYGLPIGVDHRSSYAVSHRLVRTGQIVLIGTDGIWEARDPNGEMFGKQRFKAVVHRHAQAPARELVEQVMVAVKQFRGSDTVEDDVTLVVLKIEQGKGPPA